ncbi:MAG: hypothetical protein GX608_11190 [Lentisphaerae bacterium]|nr:hypothetical protein [Lentisphaerota bacterium]
MIRTRAAFIVYGVHKDGLKDPMGAPFIDGAIVARAKAALRKEGIGLVEYGTVVASKAEAREAMSAFKKRDDVDAVILFSGTWVWAANLAAAIRDYASGGRGVVVWTHPGSQGWRPVGGLVMHGGLKEIGVPHTFVYGAADDPASLARLSASLRASAMKNRLNMATFGVFGGRGMGQTCGVADPSQWMRVFGVDLDSRDTTGLIRAAGEITAAELRGARASIQRLFSEKIPAGKVADRSIRLYLALRKIVEREGWAGYTIQSFPGLGDDYGATCFAQSLMLNDRVGVSTLSDFNTLLTVKLLGDMGDEPVYYGDLQHIDKASREVKIIGDGACPPGLAGRLGPAGFPSSSSASRAKACWRAWAAIKANSNSCSAAAPCSSPRPKPCARACSSAASRSGRTPSSGCTPTRTRSSRPGTTNTPASATARTCTTSWSHSASRPASAPSRCRGEVLGFEFWVLSSLLDIGYSIALSRVNEEIRNIWKREETAGISFLISKLSPACVKKG